MSARAWQRRKGKLPPIVLTITIPGGSRWRHMRRIDVARHRRTGWWPR